MLIFTDHLVLGTIISALPILFHVILKLMLQDGCRICPCIIYPCIYPGKYILYVFTHGITEAYLNNQKGK